MRFWSRWRSSCGLPYVPTVAHPRTYVHGEPVIPYMETKGGAFYSDHERDLTTHQRHSRNNQSHANSALGFRTFRPHRQEKDPTL